MLLLGKSQAESSKQEMHANFGLMFLNVYYGVQQRTSGPLCLLRLISAWAPLLEHQFPTCFRFRIFDCSEQASAPICHVLVLPAEEEAEGHTAHARRQCRFPCFRGVKQVGGDDRAAARGIL